MACLCARLVREARSIRSAEIPESYGESTDRESARAEMPVRALFLPKNDRNSFYNAGLRAQRLGNKHFRQILIEERRMHEDSIEEGLKRVELCVKDAVDKIIEHGIPFVLSPASVLTSDAPEMQT